MKVVLLLILGSAALAWIPTSFGGAASSLAADGAPSPIVILPRTGQVLTYDQSGKVIDFKGSGQDGEFQRGAVWPDPRFVVNADGTISDGLTGLMWLKAGNCFRDLPWPTALQALSDFNRGEIICPGMKVKYNDWFVPDLAQLASLVDAQAPVIGDSLRLIGFSEVQNGAYWSATPHRNQQNAWSVSFANGSISAVSKLERHFVLVARLPGSEKDKDSKGGGQPSLVSPVSVLADSSPQRFLDNGDGTVTDLQTGLSWLQDAACLPMLDWQGALSVANQVTGNGGVADCPSLRGVKTDWSLPNVVELRSLIDYRTDYPALSPEHPFHRVMPTGYWTATTVVGAPEYAFVGDMETGAILPVNK
ncbi:MAG: DUF1566 domain-containing protein, partial [Desulfobulbaceae bacterium]|nr:DUF1566 domain-containing protein [Desulfobulbaceae bacterium]